MEVKSTAALCRGPVLDSQHPHDSLQLSVIPVPGDPIPSLAFAGTKLTWYTNIHASQTPICITQKQMLGVLEKRVYLTNWDTLERGVVFFSVNYKMIATWS